MFDEVLNVPANAIKSNLIKKVAAEVILKNWKVLQLKIPQVLRN